MTVMGPAEATASARALRTLIGQPTQRRHFLLGFRSRSAVLRVQRRPFKAADVARLRSDEGYPLAIRGEVTWSEADAALHFRSPQAARALPRWAVFKRVLARELPAFRRCQLADAVLHRAPPGTGAVEAEDAFPAEVHGLEAPLGGLRFDRGEERVPGSDPALSFQEALLTLRDPDLDGESFQWLSGLLADAWAAEVGAGLLPEGTSFQAYKLQFLPLDVPGRGPVSAVEWGLLHIQAADLPDTPRHLTRATISWVDEAGAPQRITRRLSLEATTRDAARAALSAEGWPADGLDITLHEVIADLPAAEDVLASLDAIPAGTLRALLAGPDGAPLDLSAPDALLDLQDLAAPLIRNLAVGAVFRRWSEGAGAAVGGLLSPLPDPGRLFLQPTPEPDLPGKCAPLSAASAALCGIGSAARAGLDALRADGATRSLAEELAALLDHAPMDQDTRAAIDGTVEQLRAAAPRALWPQVDAAERLVSTVLSRLQPGHDEHGPYFEMTFSVPHSPAARGLRAGPCAVRLRAEDLQALGAELRSPDPYPGVRQPLGGPSPLARLADQGAIGAGLIAAGIDKALRASGSPHGLLYGTAPEVVASMLHSQEQRTHHIQRDAGPERICGLLQYAGRRGGGVSARLGRDAASGRAAAVLGWGQPHLGGAPIPAHVLADCTAASIDRIRRGLAACPPLRALRSLGDDELPDAVAQALQAALTLERGGPQDTVLLLDDRGTPRACALSGDPDLPLDGLTVTVRR